jgi:hypothetical protein
MTKYLKIAVTNSSHNLVIDNYWTQFRTIGLNKKVTNDAAEEITNVLEAERHTEEPEIYIDDYLTSDSSTTWEWESSEIERDLQIVLPDTQLPSGLFARGIVTVTICD